MLITFQKSDATFQSLHRVSWARSNGYAEKTYISTSKQIIDGDSISKFYIWCFHIYWKWVETFKRILIRFGLWWTQIVEIYNILFLLYATNFKKFIWFTWILCFHWNLPIFEYSHISYFLTICLFEFDIFLSGYSWCSFRVFIPHEFQLHKQVGTYLPT